MIVWIFNMCVLQMLNAHIFEGFKPMTLNIHSLKLLLILQILYDDLNQIYFTLHQQYYMLFFQLSSVKLT